MNIQQSIFSALSKSTFSLTDYIYVDSKNGKNFRAYISNKDFSEMGTRYTTVKEFLTEMLDGSFSETWQTEWNSK